MNNRIRELAKEAGHRYIPSSNSGPLRVEYLTPELEKFAELIVKECCNAADMARDADCIFPGDYVGEYMGYGEEHGITAWRCK